MSEKVNLENAMTALMIMEHFPSMSGSNLESYAEESGMFELRLLILEEIAPKIDSAYEHLQEKLDWNCEAAYDGEIVPHILDALDGEELHTAPQSRYLSVMRSYMTEQLERTAP